MKALIQRVDFASVEVKEKIIGKIAVGLLILLGIGQKDTELEAQWLMDKICNLRIFSDKTDKLNLSLLDIKGEVLLISQFTLYADCSKGRRPNFEKAGSPEKANKLYEYCAQLIKEKNLHCAQGRFAADMKVSLLNNGPVTIMLEKSAED